MGFPWKSSICSPNSNHHSHSKIEHDKPWILSQWRRPQVTNSPSPWRPQLWRYTAQLRGFRGCCPWQACCTLGFWCEGARPRNLGRWVVLGKPWASCWDTHGYPTYMDLLTVLTMGTNKYQVGGSSTSRNTSQKIVVSIVIIVTGCKNVENKEWYQFWPICVTQVIPVQLVGDDFWNHSWHQIWVPHAERMPSGLTKKFQIGVGQSAHMWARFISDWPSYLWCFFHQNRQWHPRHLLCGWVLRCFLPEEARQQAKLLQLGRCRCRWVLPRFLAYSKVERELHLDRNEGTGWVMFWHQFINSSNLSDNSVKQQAHYIRFLSWEHVPFLSTFT